MSASLHFLLETVGVYPPPCLFLLLEATHIPPLMVLPSILKASNTTSLIILLHPHLPCSNQSQERVSTLETCVSPATVENSIEVPLKNLKIKLPYYPGEENGSPLQHSCLENPTDGRAQQATVHGVAKSQIRPSDFTFTFFFHHIIQLLGISLKITKVLL